MISWSIVYHRLRTVNLYCIAPKHVCLELIPRTWQVKARTLIKCLFALCYIGREISRRKQSSWMRSNVSTIVKTYSCRYPWDLGSLSATRLCRFFATTSDGRTSGGCSIVLVVSPLVSLIMEAIAVWAHCKLYVYLVWLFLRITTMCNLYIIGLICRRFLESVAHAQTVDTRPIFPPLAWPGYEANCMPTLS